METKTEKVFARFTPSEVEVLDGGRGEKTTSTALRDAVAFTADIGVLSAPPEQLSTVGDIVKTALAATATFSAAADPVLADHYRFNCNYHREWLIAEIADSDLSFVLRIANALDANQAGIESALIERFDRFFAANPGAEFYELARDDLVWLEIGRSETASVRQNEYVAYVAAGVERAMVRERYLWHRRLLSELAARGVDYKALFVWNESEKMFRLIERPRLRQVLIGGRLETEIGEPATAPAKAVSNSVEPSPRPGQIGAPLNVSSSLRGTACDQQ